MKTLYLLGDSIRRGYEPMLREKLAGQATILSPDINCEFTQYTLRHLHEWAEESGSSDEIDLVHWNNGLWDAARLFGDECLTPIDVYAETLRRIHKRIGTVFPKAKVIFALSTPIIEERYQPSTFFRLNKDIREYNDIASRVMDELNVEINDLYSVAGNFTISQYTDATHFTEEGYNILADAVVKVCRPYLQN